MEKKKLKSIIIAVIAGIGLCATAELALVYYNAIFAPDAAPSICAINEFLDCDAVARTSESQFLGVPLALWGMFWYLFVFLMLKAEELKEHKWLKFLEVFKNPLDYIAVLGLFSFVVSIILLCVSLYEIKKLCIFCAFTYVLNLAIALVAVRPLKEGSFWGALKQSWFDFVAGVSIKKYAIALAAVVLCASAFLTYTSVSLVFAPHVKDNREFMKLKNAKMEDYLISGNHIGSPDAPIVVEVYSDYDCPVCRYLHIQLYMLVKKYSNIQFVHKNYPLDNECNTYLQIKGHDNSCMKARYAEAAMMQGKLNDFAAHLFAEQPENEEAVLKIAQDLGLDMNKLKYDANTKVVADIIKSDLTRAMQLGLLGTPVMVIGDHKKMGLNSFDETEKWLELNGAKRK